MMRFVETETKSVLSYVDLIKKVVLLVADENASTCKLASRVLIAVGNDSAVYYLYS